MRYADDAIRSLVEKHGGSGRPGTSVRVHDDTSDFFRVDYGDVVDLGGRYFLVRNYEREGRFGIDDEPKYWVRRALDLSDGSTKILKLEFHEYFEARYGVFKYDCARSPKKEARILALVQGRDDFMQGFSVDDVEGNNVRVLDYIKGRMFHDRVLTFGDSYEDYYYNHLPARLDEYLLLLDAIEFLHENGETHGDIRRDHIIHDTATQTNRWIDFDYLCTHRDNPLGYDLAGLGNILIYIVGRGDYTLHELKKSGSPVLHRLTQDDMNLIFGNRVANISKIYDFICEPLVHSMMHFSEGATVFYDNVPQLREDVMEARGLIKG